MISGCKDDWLVKYWWFKQLLKKKKKKRVRIKLPSKRCRILPKLIILTASQLHQQDDLHLAIQPVAIWRALQCLVAM